MADGYWSVLNKKLTIYPDPTDKTVLVLGRYAPATLDEDDLDSELISPLADVTVDTDEILFLPPHLMRLFRLRVQERLCEDNGDLQRAEYFGNKARSERHQLLRTHEDHCMNEGHVLGYVRSV